MMVGSRIPTVLVALATVAAALLAPAPAVAESKTFKFRESSVIRSLTVHNRPTRVRLVTRVVPGARAYTGYLWHVKTNRIQKRGVSRVDADFYVGTHKRGGTIMQMLNPNWDSLADTTVKCPGLRAGRLPRGRGAWVSIPRRCLTDGHGIPMRRIKVDTAVHWGTSSGVRAPHNGWTRWVNRG